MAEDAKTGDTNVGVSVVLCTYNGSRVILRALEALAAQTFGGPAELILVDNNSNDGVAEKAQRYWSGLAHAPFPLHLVSESQPGLAFARRAGTRAAKFELIVFCDDDNLLAPDYLARAAAAFADPAIGAVGGGCVPVSESEFPPFFYSNARYYAVGVPQLDSGPVDSGQGWLYGAGLTVRRQALLTIYDSPEFPNLTGRAGSTADASGEDLELCYSLRFLGYRLVYDEGLTFRHFIEPRKLAKDYLRVLTGGNKKDAALLHLYRPLLELDRDRGFGQLARKCARFLIQALRGRNDVLALFWILAYFGAVPLMSAGQSRVYRHYLRLTQLRKSPAG